MTQVYQAVLMDHYRHPRNRQLIANPDFCATRDNPLCGDSVTVTGRVCDNVIVSIGFDGQGCVLSQAAASMISESLVGKLVTDILALNHAEHVRTIMGIELGPTRFKCAALAFDALVTALHSAHKKTRDTNA